MKTIWEYISVRAKYALTKKQAMSLTMLLLGIFHAWLVFFFAFYSIPSMVVIDSLAIVLYIFCYIKARKNENLLFLFNLSYVEIMLHSLAAILLTGVNSGFALFPIAMLPLGYYATYNFDMEKKAVNPMIYVIASVAVFLLARGLGSVITPMHAFSDRKAETILYIVNYIVVLIIIILFFSTLLNQIKLLESQRIHQNKKLEELSKTDALTGLANRRSLQERYEDSELLKGGYALILGDIDDFKQVNDTYGHNIGDETLKAVSDVFKSAVRGEDTVCRWGGEEILIFLPGCPLDNAKIRAQHILENIRKLSLKTQDGKVFHITMTLGVAVSDGSDTFSEVVEKADDRLYKGKNEGKNQVV